MRKIKISKVRVGNFFLFLSLVLTLVLFFSQIKWILYVMVITACIGIVFKLAGNLGKLSKIKKELET